MKYDYNWNETRIQEPDYHQAAMQSKKGTTLPEEAYL